MKDGDTLYVTKYALQLGILTKTVRIDPDDPSCTLPAVPIGMHYHETLANARIRVNAMLSAEVIRTRDKIEALQKHIDLLNSPAFIEKTLSVSPMDEDL